MMTIKLWTSPPTPEIPLNHAKIGTLEAFIIFTINNQLGGGLGDNEDIEMGVELVQLKNEIDVWSNCFL